MAITVKKKSLKLKTDGAAPNTTGGDPPAADEPSPTLATMGRPTSMSAPQSNGSFALSFVMALIACVLLGALVAIQFVENSYYTGIVP